MKTRYPPRTLSGYPDSLSFLQRSHFQSILVDFVMGQISGLRLSTLFLLLLVRHLLLLAWHLFLVASCYFSIFFVLQHA